jgi:P-type Ca2+ transporter type 2C
MITGDIKETAESVGRSIGILDENEVKPDKSFTGLEFESFSESKQNEIVQNFLQRPNGMIFSRTEPKHKRQLVQLLSKHVNYFINIKFFNSFHFSQS